MSLKIDLFTNYILALEKYCILINFKQKYTTFNICIVNFDFGCISWDNVLA